MVLVLFPHDKYMLILMSRSNYQHRLASNGILLTPCFRNVPKSETEMGGPHNSIRILKGFFLSKL